MRTRPSRSAMRLLSRRSTCRAPQCLSESMAVSWFDARFSSRRRPNAVRPSIVGISLKARLRHSICPMSPRPSMREMLFWLTSRLVSWTLASRLQRREMELPSRRRSRSRFCVASVPRPMCSIRFTCTCSVSRAESFSSPDNRSILLHVKRRSRSWYSVSTPSITRMRLKERSRARRRWHLLREHTRAMHCPERSSVTSFP
mmetsp:Transcript_46619/g.111042  ORF Transcript_46619/g.111042 Transcript_46619/m.111042 type:complete len:201 (+) Transcript_46619:2090-2692(+)